MCDDEPIDIIRRECDLFTKLCLSRYSIHQTSCDDLSEKNDDHTTFIINDDNHDDDNIDDNIDDHTIFIMSDDNHDINDPVDITTAIMMMMIMRMTMMMCMINGKRHNDDDDDDNDVDDDDDNFDKFTLESSLERV